ncbi:exopolysaccharide biosynthesis polyprenyl glycosylphosphotransferase [Anaerolinea thermolimosa]|uniref:Exopolysaccharide biosynthesis polyprenyl glycosylphosphotransferase n=1 Tax=Anaerolinea thermolimosa TaxID=229919 RepID=A0A7U9PV70_9CHLR|nr:sugar transferase [Anaerolinea thermolimosa]GAP08785.1 exopolysaccharide biosynthesis polyprenyl glycosylphosphotransferase [Anaerolinea thermolimosa]GAP08835.1 exopolysaccharide biosynthesis polyprenyl glycosylphosphotransferase [Anaerolinea thermolimosa]
MRLSNTRAFPFEYETVQSRISQAKQSLVHAHQWKLFVLALILLDFLSVGLAFRVAYFVRFNLGFPLFRLEVVPNYEFYIHLVYVLIPGWLLLYAFFGLYNRQYLLSGTREYARIFSATLTGMLLVIVVGFLGPDFVVARGWLVASWLLAFLFTSGGRFLVRRLIRIFREKGFFIAPALIIGANEEGQLLAEQLSDWKYSGLNVLGYVDNHPPAEGSMGAHPLPYLGGTPALDELVRRFGIEELVVATSAISREDLLDLFKKYGVGSGVNLRLSSGLYEIITTGLDVTEIASVPLVKVNKVRLTGVDRVLKNLMDYSIALLLMIPLLPVMGIIALLIKLDSPGPVIHRRRVMGVNGKTFDAFKFRTMYVNGDEILEQYPELKEELARTHKLKDDPRVTRVGKFLRKFSLDELPQLFNVLRHEMSIVGPRMISPAEINEYRKYGINLLTVRPGITGLWQVSGRSDVSYDERVRLDMYYIRNWTVWLDLQLLLRTIPAVIKGRGAY